MIIGKLTQALRLRPLIPPVFAGVSGMASPMSSGMLTAFIGAGLLFLASPGTARASAQYPDIVRGVWMPEGSEGRQQCRNYETNIATDPEAAANMLVGAELIGGTIWHSHSEYGEGNFYFVEGLAFNADRGWTADVSVGMDSAERSDKMPKAAIYFQLRGQVLWFRIVSAGFENLSDQRFGDISYFRCASLPQDMYNRY